MQNWVSKNTRRWLSKFRRKISLIPFVMSVPRTYISLIIPLLNISLPICVPSPDARLSFPVRLAVFSVLWLRFLSASSLISFP
jgi:hypothetical protein